MCFPFNSMIPAFPIDTKLITDIAVTNIFDGGGYMNLSSTDKTIFAKFYTTVAVCGGGFLCESWREEENLRNGITPVTNVDEMNRDPMVYMYTRDDICSQKSLIFPQMEKPPQVIINSIPQYISIF